MSKFIELELVETELKMFLNQESIASIHEPEHRSLEGTCLINLKDGRRYSVKMGYDELKQTILAE